jgi:hypothetical protein
VAGHAVTVGADGVRELSPQGRHRRCRVQRSALGHGENDFCKSDSHTDVFLLCFSLADRSSYLNVRDKWIAELKKSANVAKLLLVRTKSDLRDGAGADGVSAAEGAAMAKQIGAFDY